MATMSSSAIITVARTWDVMSFLALWCEHLLLVLILQDWIRSNLLKIMLVFQVDMLSYTNVKGREGTTGLMAARATKILVIGWDSRNSQPNLLYSKPENTRLGTQKTALEIDASDSVREIFLNHHVHTLDTDSDVYDAGWDVLVLHECRHSDSIIA